MGEFVFHTPPPFLPSLSPFPLATGGHNMHVYRTGWQYDISLRSSCCVLVGGLPLKVIKMLSLVLRTHNVLVVYICVFVVDRL